MFMDTRTRSTRPYQTSNCLNVQMDTLAKEILHTVDRDDVDMPDAIPLSTKGLIQVDYGEIPITIVH